MLLKLFLLFVVIPLLELWLLIEITTRTSIWYTIGLVIVTGFIGANLARRQGAATWLRVQTELSQGKMPGDALVDAVLILVAGIVLLTPGVMTDLVGFALLIPPIRSIIKKILIARYKNRITLHSNMSQMNGWPEGMMGGFPGNPDEPDPTGDTIDSTFEEKADKSPAQDRPRDRVIGSRVIEPDESDKKNG